MKAKFTTFPILILLLFNGNEASSQSDPIPLLRSVFLNQNVYKTIDELEVQKVYKHTDKSIINDTTKYKVKPAKGSFIRYRVINDDESIIQILPLNKFVRAGNKNTIEFRGKGETPPITDNPSDYYFKIVDELTTPAKKFLATQHLTAIPVTIPIKYRFNAYDTDSKFTFDANIAYAFGYKIRVNPNPYKERYVRALLAIGVGLQEYMPRDSVKSETFKPDNELVFTYSFGVAYEGGSNFNVGLFLGWDRMFGEKKDWYYQNKPWMGIGIGYKFD
jgi:hypothetical protein